MNMHSYGVFSDLFLLGNHVFLRLNFLSIFQWLYSGYMSFECHLRLPKQGVGTKVIPKAGIFTNQQYNNT